MVSPEDIIVQQELEASHNADGSYMSNLCLETCKIIRALIRESEASRDDNIALRCSNDGYLAQIKLLQAALELNGGKQAKKARKKKNN